MGFASYYEDILDHNHNDLVESAEEDLTDLERQANERGALADGVRNQIERLRTYIQLCKQVEYEIRRVLEVATDPTLDLAHEVIQLRKKNEQLEGLTESHKKERTENKREQLIRDYKLREEREKRQQAEDAMGLSDEDIERMTMPEERRPGGRPSRGGLDPKR